MISKKRFWGLALPIWVDEQTGDFEVIGSRAGTEGARRRGLGRVRGAHAASALDRSGQDPQSEDRQPDGAHPGRGQSLARRRHRAVFDDGVQHATATTGRNGSRPTSSRRLPRPVPQLVLRHPGHEHDDGTAARRSRCCSAMRLVRDQKGEEMHKSKGNSIPFDGAADTGYELFASGSNASPRNRRRAAGRRMRCGKVGA